MAVSVYRYIYAHNILLVLVGQQSRQQQSRMHPFRLLNAQATTTKSTPPDDELNERKLLGIGVHTTVQVPGIFLQKYTRYTRYLVSFFQNCTVPQACIQTTVRPHLTVNRDRSDFASKKAVARSGDKIKDARQPPTLVTNQDRYITQRLTSTTPSTCHVRRIYAPEELILYNLLADAHLLTRSCPTNETSTVNEV